MINNYIKTVLLPKRKLEKDESKKMRSEILYDLLYKVLATCYSCKSFEGTNTSGKIKLSNL